jgi:hypothetical protein
MITAVCIALLGLSAGITLPQVADTLRLEVGSPEVDGRRFPPHLARNRVYIGDNPTPVTDWTNQLTVGDSAGVSVMRWVTRGRQRAPDGGEATWELLQTYNARTLAPMAYSNTYSTGVFTHFTIDGTRVRGVRRAPGASEDQPIDRTLDRLGFIASASDLVPMAVGLREDLVIIAPVWGPNMAAPEVRVFSVLGRENVRVEGSDVEAWKVEERLESSGRLLATWYLTDTSPYMVYAEIDLPNGQVQRITGVSLDP